MWKPVRVGNKNLTKYYDFTDTYEVSNEGQIRNIKRGSILKDYRHKSGYHTISLSKDGFTKSFFLHRVVACSFHPVTAGKTFVNHKDRNKSNNNENNLEWCTLHENNRHARQTGFKLYKRPVTQYSEKGDCIREFESVKEAAEHMDVHSAAVIHACKCDTVCTGFIWKYSNKPGNCAVNSVEYNSTRFVFIQDIEANPNYEIYSDGHVYSKTYSRFLNPTTRVGYLSVTLHPEAKSYLIHQLVAEAFIDNPEQKLYVNHIDRNRQNNHYKNLEWCTHQENLSHALNKPVYQYDKDGEFVKTYSSTKEASEETGVVECWISSVVHGRGQTGGGFIWRGSPTKFTSSQLQKLYNPPNPRIQGVIQMDRDRSEIATFSSIKEASTELNIDTSAISKVCKGKLKSTGGFKWKYVSDGSERRLTVDEVQEIRELSQQGLRVKELAYQYSKSVSSIQRVLSGRSFAI